MPSIQPPHRRVVRAVVLVILPALTLATAGPGLADEALIAPETAALAGPARPASPRLSDLKACAAFDLHLVRHAEEHGEAGEVRPERLAALMEAVAEARRLCSGGETRAALALYGASGLGPVRSRWLR
jgi:hypothetical protein